MSNYFVFDGVSSLTYNVSIATSNMFDSAERDVSVVSVAGRDGDLTLENNRFMNIDRKVTAYIPSDMQTYIDGFRNWMLSKTGYCRYTEYLRPNEYRMALYKGPLAVESDRRGAVFDLNFQMKPQRFLTSGETTQTFTEDSTITNPTLFASKPLIRIYGTGTVEIGSTEITFTGSTAYVDIDCELQDAYYSSANMNSYVTLDPDEFPTLEPGSNGIVLGSGITSVEITPRWWCL